MRTSGMSETSATGKNTDHVRDLLRRAPVFHDQDLSTLEIEPMGSTVNLVFKIGFGSKSYALRIPGRERFINPFSEYQNQNSASAAGSAPQCLWYDDVTGSLLTAWLPRARPIRAEDIEDSARRGALSQTLAGIHYDTQPFCDGFAPADALAWNLRGPAGQHPRIQGLSARADELMKDMAPVVVNCHGDPVCANILVLDDSPGAVWFVDWEYSHRTTPYWDLAILCNSIDADNAFTRSLIDDYNQYCSEYSAVRLVPSKLKLFRGLTALISAAWIVNHAEPGTDAESMIRVAREFLDA